MNEHEAQSLVVSWARLNTGRWPMLEWLFAVPNGAQYGKDKRLAYIQNNKLKAEGLTPGISDLCLPWAARGFHGFYIEMKAPGKIKDVRPGQADFLAYLETAGYLGQVHDSAESAIEAISWYLSEPAPIPLAMAIARTSWDVAIGADERRGR